MPRNAALLRLTSRLIARRNALRKALESDLNGFGRMTEWNGVQDDVDSALDAANGEICTRVVEFESRELAQIENALKRIAAGVYGRCEACGRRIPAPRLNALPYTSRCIDCQRESEGRHHSIERNPDWASWERLYQKSFASDEDEPETDLSDHELSSQMSAHLASREQSVIACSR